MRRPNKADAVRRTLAAHADASRLAFVAVDLLSDAGRTDAVQGVQGVLHLASPFPLTQPKDQADLIASCLHGKYPGCPRLSFPVVDVRDVARAHRLALESEAPSGARDLATSGAVWFKDLMRPIRDQLGHRAKKVPTRKALGMAFMPHAGSGPAMAESQLRLGLVQTSRCSAQVRRRSMARCSSPSSGSGSRGSGRHFRRAT